MAMFVDSLTALGKQLVYHNQVVQIVSPKSKLTEDYRT